MEEREHNWNPFPVYCNPMKVQSYNHNQRYFGGKPNLKFRGNRKGRGYPISNPFYHGRGRMNFSKAPVYPDQNNIELFKKKDKVIVDPVKEISPWSEEAQEEARKKELSDAANKLLNKLKKWSSNKDDVQDGDNDNSIEGKDGATEQCSEVKNDCGKGKIIETDKIVNGAPTETKKIKAKQSNKKISGSRKTVFRSQTKQRKIQQKLIGELMTMPKDNLNKLLLDPKLHPKIEVKMAQIVKENRLLLAHKFRNLAESKINNQGQFVCTQFFDDLGSLIDPDLAVDLCQLPPELIKQMGDIFQLDFESVNQNNSTDLDGTEVQISKDEVGDTISEETSPIPLPLGVKEEVQDDSERDVEFICNGKKPEVELVDVENEFFDSTNGNATDFVTSVPKKNIKMEPDENDCGVTSEHVKEHNSVGEVDFNFSIKKMNCECSFESVNKMEVSEDTLAELGVTVKQEISEEIASDIPVDGSVNKTIGSPKIRCKPIEDMRSNSSVLHECEIPTEFVNSITTGTENERSIHTQTDINLIETESLMHMPDTVDSLMTELKAVDNLICKLNQRRFLLFLKFMDINPCNPSGNQLNKFLKIITNGDSNILKKAHKLNTIVSGGNKCKQKGSKGSGSYSNNFTEIPPTWKSNYSTGLPFPGNIPPLMPPRQSGSENRRRKRSRNARECSNQTDKSKKFCGANKIFDFSSKDKTGTGADILSSREMELERNI